MEYHSELRGSYLSGEPSIKYNISKSRCKAAKWRITRIGAFRIRLLITIDSDLPEDPLGWKYSMIIIASLAFHKENLNIGMIN